MKPEDRRWEPEELEAVCQRGLEYGEIKAIAKRIGRTLVAVRQKRMMLRRGRRLRMRCGAFLPDDGIPYRVRMLRIYREHKA